MLPAYRDPAYHAPAGRRDAGGHPGRHPGRHPGGQPGRGATVAAGPRRRWGAWLAVLSIVLLAAGTAGVAWWYGDGRFVQVPPVAGLTREAAAARVDAAGLVVGFDSAPSDTVAAGLAVRSEPGQGDRLTRGRTVVVVLSLGPQLVDVPDVVGDARGAAETRVRAAGLVPVVVPQPSEDVDAGEVLSQAPGDGQARRGSQVRLVVSSGPDLIEVPDVIGSSVADARRTLEDAGLRVRAFSLKIGNVVRQSPAAGERVRRGTRVTIFGL
jgi:serine/threonine-protein kinase